MLILLLINDVSGMKKGLRHVTMIMIILLSFTILQTLDTRNAAFFHGNSSVKVPTDTKNVCAENYEDMNLSSLNLSLFLNETDASIIGNLTIDFFNSDPVVLSSIPFHLYLSGMLADGRPGDIAIMNVSALTPSPVQLAFDVYSDEQIMWVYLDEDLQPNSSVLIKILFESVLPIDSPDRAGVNGSDLDSSRIFEYASAYPIPCVYDEYDGWNTDPYLDTGDPFYLDMAYYNLSLTVPSAMKVAATGELMNLVYGSTYTTYVFTPVRPVREITFSASRYYIIESQIYHGVNTSTYYLPGSVSLWNSNALSWGIRAMSLYNDTFGRYSYTTLNIVEDYGFYYGMEYPCQVYLSNIIYDRYQSSQITASTLDAVIAHEVAHQWWYNLVGNDEIDVGFLDEGLAVWSTYYYSEFYGLGWTGKENDFEEVRSTYPAKINQSIYDDPSTYYFTAYTKTPVVLEKLRQIIGTNDYLDSLRLYFTRFSYRVAFLKDLQTAFEDYLTADLDWFFVPMFDNAYLPHYAFGGATYNTTTRQLTVNVEDLNEALHTQDYLQNFTFEVETTHGTFSFPSVQLFGTAEVVLLLPESITSSPTGVRLLFDIYSLVQLDNPQTYFITTSITTAATTSSTEPTGPGWDARLATYLAVGIVCVIIILGVITLVRKKR
ncbi:MAG: hypothetical protein EAX87_14280 [Candidatus Thorarchaeota archaeon]|nr:hypothetical protein [Candidatus Thorarchaeota archaeon]